MKDWPLWEVFVRSRRGLSPRPRRVAARPRRRDGAAQRPRRLHPAPGGRLALGRAGRRDHRVQPGREGRVLRPGRRQDLPAPDLLRGAGGGASTCEPTRPGRPTSSASATTPWSPRSGWAGGSAARPSWRRTSRWPTSPSTSSARPAACWPTPVRSRAPGGTRTSWPTCATSASSATSSSSSCPDRLRRRDGPAAVLRDLAVRAVRRARAQHRRALAAVAGKAVKEVAYHLDHARHWVLRLGDGTEESHLRMQAALDAVWPFVDELFEPAAPGPGRGRRRRRSGDAAQPGPATGSPGVVDEATLTLPDVPAAVGGGRRGLHTEHLGYLLAEMQHLTARTRGRRGDARTTRQPEPGAAGRGRARPGAAGRHDRGPRHPARRHRGRPGPGRRADHPDLLRLPGDGRDPHRHRRDADGRGLPPRRGRVRAGPGLDHRLDHRRGPRQARRVRHRAARGPGPSDGRRSARARRALPAVRLARHPRVQPLRLDRLQVALGLPRAAASPSTTSRRSDARCPPGRVPPPAGRGRRRAHRRRGRRHLRRARRAARTTSAFVPASTCPIRSGDDVRRSYSLCTPPSSGAAADRRQAGARGSLQRGRRRRSSASGTRST